MNITRDILLPLVSGKKLAVFFLIILIIWIILRISVSILEEFLIVEKPLPHADALVLMAGSQSERLPAAALLYKEGRADKILLTNDGMLGAWSTEQQRNLYQVEWAEEELVKMGVPRLDIEKLSYSSSGTIFDALNTRTAALDKRIKSIIIVTSDYHTRRSLWTFERVFQGHSVTVGVYPVQSIMNSRTYLTRFILLSYELAKYFFYNLKYQNI